VREFAFLPIHFLRCTPKDFNLRFNVRKTVHKGRRFKNSPR
jgi:hypothetical protein